MLKNIVVICAGGIGSRMKSEAIPKQFLEVCGRPILAYTIERFEEHKYITDIYVVVSEPWMPDTEELVAKGGFSKVRAVVPGGASPHESFIHGVWKAREDGAADGDVVMYHDGVRPIIDAATITKCVEGTREHGNAIAANAAYETVSQSADGETVDRILTRSEIFILQAPQSFLMKDCMDVNQKAIDDGIVGQVVDQADLCTRYGRPVHIIDGLRGNIKITVPFDLVSFEFLVKTGEYERILGVEVI